MLPKPPRAISKFEPAAGSGGRAAELLDGAQHRRELLSGSRYATAEEPPDPADWPDTAYLDSDQASTFLKQVFNLQRGPRRLAQLRAEGTGPRYFRDGNVVRYQPRHLREYAERCFGEPVRSTAEEAVRRQMPTPSLNRLPTA